MPAEGCSTQHFFFFNRLFTLAPQWRWCQKASIYPSSHMYKCLHGQHFRCRPLQPLPFCPHICINIQYMMKYFWCCSVQWVSVYCLLTSVLMWHPEASDLLVQKRGSFGYIVPSSKPSFIDSIFIQHQYSWYTFFLVNTIGKCLTQVVKLIKLHSWLPKKILKDSCQHPISWLMTVLEDVLFVMHISQTRNGLTY